LSLTPTLLYPTYCLKTIKTIVTICSCNQKLLMGGGKEGTPLEKFGAQEERAGT